MRVIDKRERIERVPIVWYKQYYKNDKFCGREKYKDIYEKLLKMVTEIEDHKVLEKEIINLIGNDSWTRNECYVCECDRNLLIGISTYEKYETDEILICENCLNQALNLLKEVKHD
jgi:hypothetical protein